VTRCLRLSFSWPVAAAIEALEHAIHHHVGQRLWGWAANVGIPVEAEDRPVVQLGAAVIGQELPQGAPAAGLRVCGEVPKIQEFQ